MLTTLRTIPARTGVEPISLERARRHCRIDNADDDELLGGIISAARSWCESFLGRALLAQKYIWTIAPSSDIDPGRETWWHSHLSGVLELPRAPVLGVNSVVLLDHCETEWPLTGPNQLLAQDGFELEGQGGVPFVTEAPVSGALWGYTVDLDMEPARLHIRNSRLVSLGARFPIRHLKITFIAGYRDAESIPKPIIQAILLLIAFYYERRGDEGSNEPPEAILSLLWMHRMAFFG